MNSFVDYMYQSWLSFKALFGWLDIKSYILIKVINPILQLVFFCLLAKYAFKPDDLTPWIIGNSFMLSTVYCIFGLGSVLLAERFFGTLKSVIISPCNKFLLFFQRGLMHIFDAFVTVSMALIVGNFIFDINLNNSDFFLFILIVFVSVFAATSLGLLLSTLGLVFSNMNLFNNIIVLVLLAFSGANFPIEQLPRSIGWIPNILPITRSIKAVNAMIGGADTNYVLSLLSVEMIYSILLIVIGYLSIIYMEKISREKATLDFF